MDWLEKAKDERRKREEERNLLIKAMNEKREWFLKTGLLEKLRAKAKEINAQPTDIYFELHESLSKLFTPPKYCSKEDILSHCWRVSLICLKRYSDKYSDFSLHIDKDRVWWRGFATYAAQEDYYSYERRPKKEINPYKITDEDIHNWVGRLVEEILGGD